MRRLRLAIFGDSPCHLCRANCCRQNGHEYAVLLVGERERRRFAAFSVEVTIAGDGGTPVRERVLPYVDGRCQFLDADERCTIYDDRPTNCRLFQCLPFFHKSGGDVRGHGEFLVRNADVARMLESL